MSVLAPGLFVGEAFLDYLLNHSIHSIIYCLSHELGHIIINGLSLQHERQQAWIEQAGNTFGSLGTWTTSKFLNVTDKVWDKHDEILADHIALYICNKTRRVDIIQALSSQRKLGLYREQMVTGIDTDLLDSHPHSSLRASCIVHTFLTYSDNSQ